MYLARVCRDRKTRYIIRESVRRGDHWSSRELLDLGLDPAAFLVYPGGNAFYVATEVTDRLEEKGCDPDPEELESLFWPFVEPYIRHRLDHFRTRSENVREERSRLRDSGRTLPLPPLFDRRRIHYLRYGQMDQSRIGAVSPKLFRCVAEKSRDEIEQYFLEAERVLKPHERRAYLFVVFDLQRFFTEPFARTMPQALDPDRVDRRFLEEICRLNRDPVLWAGTDMDDGLNDYLVRYLIMHFDTEFGRADFLGDYIRGFADRHRRYRPPPRVEASMAEMARLFGVDRQALRRMGRSELARCYRRRAKSFHPDQGGAKADFIRLTEAYHKLLRAKR